MKYVILVALLVLVLVEYALMVVSHDADEKAERMYKRWKDERSNSKADE